MYAQHATISDAEMQARGNLLNILIPALEASGLEPETASVDETGFTVLICGRLTRIRFEDQGHYLDRCEQDNPEFSA